MFADRGMARHVKRRDSKALVVLDDKSDGLALLGEASSTHEMLRNVPVLQSSSHEVVLMSEYDEKVPNYGVYDFGQATRPQLDDYSDFATQPTTFTTPPVSTGNPGPSDFTHLVDLPHYEAYNATYYPQNDASYPAYHANASRPFLEVISCSPNRGHRFTKVTLHFRCAFDFDVSPIKPVFAFARLRCPSQLVKSAAMDDNLFRYALSADAPLYVSAGSLSPQVPLQLVFEDAPPAWDSSPLDLGHFTYLDQLAILPSDTGSKKRKLSIDASPRCSLLKKSSQHLAPAPSVSPHELSVGYQAVRPPSVSELYSQPRGFHGPDYSPPCEPYQANFRQTPYYGPQVDRTPSFQSPAWSNFSYPVSAAPSPAVAAPSLHGRTPQLLPSPAHTDNPQLIRTTTLQQQFVPPTPVVVNVDFPTHGTKAELKIEGNLDSMAKDWTEEEWEAQRRLVQFRRTQTGNVINTTFAPVSLADRTPNGICVSCILWEEKQECYVTSVDTISLLEALVGVRFTVEEKNRIRRNLEGYRPTTVSKSKPESEAFFKLIMNFPNPKPRNIEKDVKVFPWRILSRALTKIIGKYSASYSPAAYPLGFSTPSPAATNGSRYAITRSEAAAGAGAGAGAGAAGLEQASTMAAAAAYAPHLNQTSAVSPPHHSTSPGSVTSHGNQAHAYATATGGTNGSTSTRISTRISTSTNANGMPQHRHSYTPHGATGLGIGRSGPTGHLSVPSPHLASYRPPPPPPPPPPHAATGHSIHGHSAWTTPYLGMGTGDISRGSWNGFDVEEDDGIIAGVAARMDYDGGSGGLGIPDEMVGDVSRPYHGSSHPTPSIS